MDLGPLEMRVLGLLDRDTGTSVADVRARLSARGHDLAYTTVLTVLSRLHDKKAVTRVRDGRRWMYCCTKSAPTMKTAIVKRIQRALFDNDKVRPIAALLQSERLTGEELRDLRSLIDQEIAERGIAERESTK